MFGLFGKNKGVKDGVDGLFSLSWPELRGWSSTADKKYVEKTLSSSKSELDKREIDSMEAINLSCWFCAHQITECRMLSNPKASFLEDYVIAYVCGAISYCCKDASVHKPLEPIVLETVFDLLYGSKGSEALGRVKRLEPFIGTDSTEAGRYWTSGFQDAELGVPEIIEGKRFSGNHRLAIFVYENEAS